VPGREGGSEPAALCCGVLRCAALCCGMLRSMLRLYGVAPGACGIWDLRSWDLRSRRSWDLRSWRRRASRGMYILEGPVGPSAIESREPRHLSVGSRERGSQSGDSNQGDPNQGDPHQGDPHQGDPGSGACAVLRNLGVAILMRRAGTT